MARPTIEPVTAANLAEFCEFLHRHLNSAMSPAEWQQGLRTSWSADQPNHGFLLRDAGAMVGGIGAFYADRVIDGRIEKFCNITSWCVLDSHRQQSMRLAMTVIGQAGYHFTDFSPTQVVGATLRFLKFQPIDERQVVLPNLPWPALSGEVLSRPEQIAAALQGDALKRYQDHAGYRWLRHAIVGTPGNWCHVIYKPRVLKRLPCAGVIHVSEPALLAKYWRRLGAHLLGRGFASTQVEHRWLPHPPAPAVVQSGFNPKLFLSPTLPSERIDYLYSETVALDL